MELKDVCKDCEVLGKYKVTLKDFNVMVKEHNILVDKHKNLLDDSRALVAFLSDIAIGLYSYVTGTMIFGIQVELKELPTENMDMLDEGQAFCLSFYNEIIGFIRRLREGERAKDVYKLWMNSCREAYSKMIRGKC